jgi:hypothetical protein
VSAYFLEGRDSRLGGRNHLLQADFSGNIATSPRRFAKRYRLRHQQFGAVPDRLAAKPSGV